MYAKVAFSQRTLSPHNVKYVKLRYGIFANTNFDH